MLAPKTMLYKLTMDVCSVRKQALWDIVTNFKCVKERVVPFGNRRLSRINE